jgi:hypothetical protein
VKGVAILKKEYELSVWDETLGEKGQKNEIKRAIIGAHDMTYPGRATSLKLSRKINGTNTLTFQLPSKFFDDISGDYIHNEFCDYLFNERKLKLKYDGEWFEFYIKSVSENKQFKSIMYQYSCEDAFIDELSRNGYGITFDTELYNNVEEIGIFTEQILEDSIWKYDASKNWGDFTEYSEEKLFKIPISMFSSIKGHKLNYIVEGELTNVYTGKKRQLELGDDLSREHNIFWDNGSFDKGIKLLGELEDIETDGYIYVPYSCLGFCYMTEEDGAAATEMAQLGTINGITSYYLAPQSIDPTSLIQFIAIPTGGEVQIDEAGLLVNKNYSYVMTLQEWNSIVNTNLSYDIEKKIIKNDNGATCNQIVCYDGYLENINDIELTFGKKVSISDRTEINISEDIDQYVIVYNNEQNDYQDMFTSEDWIKGDNYRICSYERTRTIVPQLARNLVQNGTDIADISGWEVMKLGVDLNDVSSSISVRLDETVGEGISSQTKGLILATNYDVSIDDSDYYRTFLNFGIVGQEEKIERDQMYVLCVKGEWGSLNEETGIWEEKLETSANDKLLVIIGNGDYDSNGDYELNGERIEFSLSNELSTNGKLNKYYFIRSSINIDNPYFCLQLNKDKYFNLIEASFFKAFTKGKDFFENGYYKYSGRDIFFNKEKEDSSWKEINNISYREANENEFIKETDVFSGDAYSYKKYFRQQIQYNEGENIKAKDTFMLKSYLNNDIEKNALPPDKYTEDDYKIITDYIDLNKCKHYVYGAAANEKDCKYTNSNGICMYQKYGYCPYLFETQKHCRKIRTLNGEKSNRFNLTQELSKVFEVYPIYYIEHLENGKIKTDNEGKMIKNVFYITEKGMENKLGFRYEKNLSNISRTLTSNEIVTKLYVEDVDSELSKTGLCSIKTAEDNPSKDSYIIDFSYYTMKGLLDENMVKADLYGIGENDLGYLKQLGYYNGKYDEISNKIINLQDESFTELQANIEVNLTGIETAQQEMNKINKTLQRYAQPKNGQDQSEESDTYKSYKTKYEEQRNILLGLIESTFMINGDYYSISKEGLPVNRHGNAQDVLDMIDMLGGFKEFKKNYLDTFKYKNYGIMGQYTEEYNQIQKWKKEKAKYLKDINRISLEFYRKYEPYLKEGTWSDSNYLSDNAYYFGAKEVAKQGAIPKVTYNISVVDLAVLDDDYTFNIADTTYVEDIETFGINPKTGLPNRLKVIISGITYDLDIPSQNSIEIQNYTSQFEDLFQQVTASVQSLSFNENIYKRSSNFTATQNVSGESLQGGLSDNKLTLLETDEKNIELDYIGQRGSDINNHNNKYKLTGEGLYFSNNGGQTWNVGVTPKGINADYINVGTLDASKIQIVDGNYLYFLWDKSGITAYREPKATSSEKTYFSDFAKFNKYGLSLVEDGKIRLRAGYNYIYGGDESDNAGDYNKEADLSTLNNIGFYLYNDKGQEIFKTESGKSDSARISLAGEIYVTQNLNEKVYTKYVYGYSDVNTPLELKSELFYKAISYDREDILNAVIYEGSTTFKDYYLSNWKESADVQYFSYTKEETITYFSVRTTEMINKKIFYINNNTETYMDGQSLNFIITFLKLEDNNFVPLEDTEGLFEVLSLINGNIFDVTAETKIIDIKGNYGYPKEYETLTSIPISTKNYYEKEANEYILKSTSAYVVQRNTNEFSLYNKIITSGSEEDVNKEDGIAIFINNQAVNDPTSSNGYYKRLISCVKAGENSVDNILSVLSDGGLYLGGKVETQDNISTLKNLSDYIRINTEGENNEAIVVKDGTIKIGGEDLVQGIMDVLGTQIQEIRTIVEQAGLIEHSHDVSGIESYPKKTTPQISNVYSVGVSNEGSLHLTHSNYAYGANASRIVLYGGMLQSAGEPIDGYFTVSIEDFFKGVQIALKEGSSTGTAGDVPGLSGGTMTSGYIVEGQ